VMEDFLIVDKVGQLSGVQGFLYSGSIYINMC